MENPQSLEWDIVKVRQFLGVGVLHHCEITVIYTRKMLIPVNSIESVIILWHVFAKLGISGKVRFRLLGLTYYQFSIVLCMLCSVSNITVSRRSTR